jgi:hypothetical protein
METRSTVDSPMDIADIHALYIRFFSDPKALEYGETTIRTLEEFRVFWEGLDDASRERWLGYYTEGYEAAYEKERANVVDAMAAMKRRARRTLEGTGNE